jgi:DNA-binding GntR family transcriptional regulator
MLDRKTARKRCMEHIHLIDLLLAGRREEASAFLHRHLSALPGLKDRARSSRLEIAAGDETGAPVQERPANKGRK